MYASRQDGADGRKRQETPIGTALTERGEKMSDFGKLINASDLIEWILETYPDWCVGAVRSIVDHVEALPSAQPERKLGKWILDEDPHDGDCRCSACWVAIDQMHERNHGLLNALTGGKWWTFYKFCPNCGARMEGEEDERPNQT